MEGRGSHYKDWTLSLKVRVTEGDLTEEHRCNLTKVSISLLHLL